MVLADRKVIEAFFTTAVPVRAGRKRKGLPKAASTIPTTTTPSSKRTKCQCGECGYCRDNARWERIFNEKFADPDYYAVRPTTVGSSLSSRTW